MRDLAFGALATVFALAAVTTVYQAYGTDNIVEFKVQEKQRVVTGEDSKYLIWAVKKSGEKEVFENTDTFLRGKFNSSDVYGDLEVGKTYKATVNGWRIPVISAYRNILTVTPVQ